MTSTIDVLVVGAGPAGLALACDLQRRGVSHRVITAAEGGFEGSRAKGVQPRTVEVLDDLGVLPYIEERSTLYPKLGLHLGPFTIPKVMIPLHDRSEDVPHPNTLLIAQYDTDAALRRRLADLGGEVEFGTRLVAFSDGPEAVVATVMHSDGKAEDVRATYLVGADGGGSTVRAASGIGFAGTTDEKDRMIVADVTLEGLSRNRWHIWPRNAGRFMALCPLPDGKFQLMLKLRPHDKADVGQVAVEALVRDFVGKAKLSIQGIGWASVWRPNIRLAERYRVGNVLLVGDAAHVHPPTGGQGMNTGIQDSYNLGWKLAQVLAGAPEVLLDTYEAERRPVAARVLGLSSEIYAAMADRPMAAATRGDEERQLSLSYAGGPLASVTDPPVPGPRSGDRAPDAEYVDSDGLTTTLHETFRGPHFTLVALGDGASSAASALEWPDEGAPLVRVAIPQPAEGLRQIYGGTGPMQIVVRPDGYIASIVHGAGGNAHQDFLRLAVPGVSG
ncbi:FAD-dependent monooxygenase [Rhodococcus sp. NPDC055112]